MNLMTFHEFKYYISSHPQSAYYMSDKNISKAASDAVSYRLKFDRIVFFENPNIISLRFDDPDKGDIEIRFVTRVTVEEYSYGNTYYFQIRNPISYDEYLIRLDSVN